MTTTEQPADGAAASAIKVAFRQPLADGVLVAGREPVALSWRIDSPASSAQVAYEVQASPTQEFDGERWTSGSVVSPFQVGAPAPGPPLRSREVRHYRLRIQTDEGWSGWSTPVRVEAGLLEPGDWHAQAITLPSDPGAAGPAPLPILRREFSVESEVLEARLHVTALGLHRVSINGQLVSEDVFSPGWTTYRYRLLADTYDVAAMLRHGSNVVSATLADGWYRGRLGWDLDGGRCRYGSEIALIAQLELSFSDGRTEVIATDETWRVATAEYLSADIYDGSTVDLRKQRPGWDMPGYDTTGWARAAVVPFDPITIEPRVAPPVRPIAVRAVSRSERGGATMLDGGQNLAGFVRLTVRGAPGDRVVVRHAEVLEPDGSLHTKSLRSARATDTFILADSAVTRLEPAFTFHGFRYAEVETTAEILGAEMVAISSDTPARSSFECSDPTLNRFHENIVWSQRGNFVSVPTDCPQRDERLGWTGDAQAFASTASTLFDTAAFWQSWLRDLELDQDDDLGVSSVVPDVVLDGPMRFGRAGWADAAAIVPWAVYESFGDKQVVERQLGSMRRWVGSLERRRGPDGLLPESPQFGDWLDPNAPSDRPWESKADPRYLANAYFARSASLVADAAHLAGDSAEAKRYRALAQDVERRTWQAFADHAVTTQTGCAVALRLGIAPERDRGRVGVALATLVRAAGGAVATGFLGTPLVLPALSDMGYYDEAYLMLLRRDPPSWLYQVEHGATTAWERWDAILPDGSIHPGTMAANPIDPNGGDGQMLSFNHYAYGAVVDWIYRNVAGLAPVTDRPGYRHVNIAPRPSVGLTWAKGSIESAYGRVSIEWHSDAESDLILDVQLPPGTDGTFRPPVTVNSRISVDGVQCDGQPLLGPGRHSIVMTNPAVADPSRVGASTPIR